MTKVWHARALAWAAAALAAIVWCSPGSAKLAANGTSLNGTSNGASATLHAVQMTLPDGQVVTF
jgi:hypothetical protein